MLLAYLSQVLHALFFYTYLTLYKHDGSFIHFQFIFWCCLRSYYFVLKTWHTSVMLCLCNGFGQTTMWVILIILIFNIRSSSCIERMSHQAEERVQEYDRQWITWASLALLKRMLTDRCSGVSLSNSAFRSAFWEHLERISLRAFKSG